MKNYIFFLFLGLANLLHAQSENAMVLMYGDMKVDTQQVQETYIQQLLEHAQVTFCKIDTVNGMAIKYIEVIFDDTTQFHAAYIESVPLTKTILQFIQPWTAYVEIDDNYGNQIVFQENDLKEYDLLKLATDALLQTTDPIKY